VAPFLSADLSDLVSNEDVINEDSINQDSISTKTDTAEFVDTDINEDIDIDALLAEVNEETPNTGNSDDLGDIGDDLLATEPDSIEDDDNKNESVTEFDQSTLTQLLHDEKESITAAELSTDYTDSNVLADLLADEDNENAPEKLTESAEINDIEQLNDLDFDELLSSIEEETPQNNNDDLDVSNVSSSDKKEDSLDENLAEPAVEPSPDFITVDSLIADTLDDVDEKQSSELYQQGNIDVGLGEFPEFTNKVNQLDVDDDDETGAAAKLDLAKVYIEIGDIDNAEVILMDVATIGDSDQQIEAKQLLDNLK
jgi:pilus assembly protein FimV